MTMGRPLLLDSEERERIKFWLTEIGHPPTREALVAIREHREDERAHP